MDVISANNLTRRYGSRIGIDRVSFNVPEGVIFGFLGPNGAGKTTTMRLLLGFLRPHQGTARILGMDCWRESHRIKADVGYLPGDVRLYPWMTAQNALRIIGGVRGMDLRAAGEALAERFELEMDVPVRRMSRGMRQKLGLLITLAPAPRLLVLDEPTGGLDPIMQLRLAEHLRNLADDGHTVLFSSHTLSEVEQLCSHVAIVRRGRIVVNTTIAELQSEARRVVRLDFDPACNPGDVRPPAFLDVCDRRGHSWRCELSGAADELIRWAATQPIVDLSVGTPDLESMFHRYYEEQDA